MSYVCAWLLCVWPCPHSCRTVFLNRGVSAVCTQACGRLALSSTGASSDATCNASNVFKHLKEKHTKEHKAYLSRWEKDEKLSGINSEFVFRVGFYLLIGFPVFLTSIPDLIVTLSYLLSHTCTHCL